MNDQSHLVTVHCFKGKDYLVKMNTQNKNVLEIKITDKMTSEDWHCSYDAMYIENLTHKTGNYKQFNIFATMLKSGLLKTSESISLDLLTFDDLEALRSRRVMGRTFTPQPANILPTSTSNRRYLILTYTVEFDRIHYPLPMEYCGLPDPHILQSTIRRLEQEVIQLQEQLKLSDNPNCDESLLDQVNLLQKRVIELTSENEQLREDVVRLNSQLNRKQVHEKHSHVLQKALTTLEEQVKKETAHSYHQLRSLKEQNSHLMKRLEEYRCTERDLRSQLHKALASRNPTQTGFTRTSRIDNLRKTSPSQSVGDHRKCIKILQENPLSNGLKKRNNKRSPLPMSKSDFPLTHINHRSSSVSSVERCRSRFHSPVSQRSSSNESSCSVTNQKKGFNSKLRPKKIIIAENSSSESSSTVSKQYKKKYCSKTSLKNSRSNKDIDNELRIHDLEKRISNLQQMLKSDLTINTRNKH